MPPNKFTIAIIGPLLGLKTQSYPDSIEELIFHLENKGYKFITASSKVSRLERLTEIVWTLVQYRKEYDLCMLKVYGGLSFIVEDIASWICYQLKKPLIMIIDGGAFPEFVCQHEKWSRNVLNRGNIIISPSRYIQDKLCSYGFSIKVIPHGLNISSYPFILRQTPLPKIIWLRAFHSIYRPTDAVEAAALLVNYFPGLCMDMIGPDKKDGSYQEVTRKIKEYHLEKNVHIYGRISKQEVPKYTNNGDIFFNTTTYESFGVGVAEAAACGLCIVTTNVGALPYIWNDGKEALLVPPKAPEAFAQAVNRLFTQKGLAGRLSQNARLKAETFDWSNIIPQFVTVIEEILNRGRI